MSACASAPFYKVVAGTPRQVVAGTPRQVVAGTPRQVVAGTPRQVVVAGAGKNPNFSVETPPPPAYDGKKYNTNDKQDSKKPDHNQEKKPIKKAIVVSIHPCPLFPEGLEPSVKTWLLHTKDRVEFFARIIEHFVMNDCQTSVAKFHSFAEREMSQRKSSIWVMMCIEFAIGIWDTSFFKKFPELLPVLKERIKQSNEDKDYYSVLELIQSCPYSKQYLSAEAEYIKWRGLHTAEHRVVMYRFLKEHGLQTCDFEDRMYDVQIPMSASEINAKFCELRCTHFANSFPRQLSPEYKELAGKVKQYVNKSNASFWLEVAFMKMEPQFATMVLGIREKITTGNSTEEVAIFDIRARKCLTSDAVKFLLAETSEVFSQEKILTMFNWVQNNTGYSFVGGYDINAEVVNDRSKTSVRKNEETGKIERIIENRESVSTSLNRCDLIKEAQRIINDETLPSAQIQNTHTFLTSVFLLNHKYLVQSVVSQAFNHNNFFWAIPFPTVFSMCVENYGEKFTDALFAELVPIIKPVLNGHDSTYIWNKICEFSSCMQCDPSELQDNKKKFVVAFLNFVEKCVKEETEKMSSDDDSLLRKKWTVIVEDMGWKHLFTFFSSASTHFPESDFEEEMKNILQRTRKLKHDVALACVQNIRVVLDDGSVKTLDAEQKKKFLLHFVHDSPDQKEFRMVICEKNCRINLNDMTVTFGPDKVGGSKVKTDIFKFY
jgi:hypothetical protein